MSLRATGEGHISSIEFREGVINADNSIHIEPTNRFVTTPDLVSDPSYEKPLFERKLEEMGFRGGITSEVLDPLPENFNLRDLKGSLGNYKRRPAYARKTAAHEESRALDNIQWLAKSNYEVEFHESVPLSERIIFPVSDNESNGIEDARFVHFTDDDGTVTYYATYTAYNGPRDPAANPGNAGLPAVQDKNAQRPRRAKQGHGAFPAQESTASTR